MSKDRMEWERELKKELDEIHHAARKANKDVLLGVAVIVCLILAAVYVKKLNAAELEQPTPPYGVYEVQGEKACQSVAFLAGAAQSRKDNHMSELQAYVDIHEAATKHPAGWEPLAKDIATWIYRATKFKDADTAFAFGFDSCMEALDRETQTGELNFQEGNPGEDATPKVRGESI